MKSSIEYNGQTIHFEARCVDRTTLEIAVHPDGRVHVKAPTGTTPDVVQARVKRRARWIKGKLEYFRQFEPRITERRYVGGETHLYLGRQYRLKLLGSTNSEVKLKGAYFLIMTPDPDDTGKVKTLLESWYARHAKRLFSTRLEQCYESARRLKVPFPLLRVQKMKKRWGSCGKQGKIILNTALVKAPLSSIDYVIMHELCHLKIRKHNERYYRMLRELMPDWEKRKATLEQTQA